MIDPEAEVAAVWHAYTEVYDPADASVSTRDERLSGDPEIILTTPEDAADWIERQIETFAAKRTVRLLNDGSGFSRYGETHDEEQRTADYGRNLDVLYQGKSLYLNFRNNSDRRMYLWAEAIQDEDREVPIE